VHGKAEQRSDEREATRIRQALSFRNQLFQVLLFGCFVRHFRNRFAFLTKFCFVNPPIGPALADNAGRKTFGAASSYLVIANTQGHPRIAR
jgi:hypothetical protein